MTRFCTLLAAVVVLAGCPDVSAPPRPMAKAEPPTFDYGADYGDIVFLRDAASNDEFVRSVTPMSLGDLSFVVADGRVVTLDDLAPNKPVVLVITRGQTQPICPVCTTQTARLIRAYPEFRDLGAEVVVVYPKLAGAGAGMFDAFLDVVAERLEKRDIDVPFPIVFDPGLKVTRKLDIENTLAKPTTLVLDADRSVRYAFVGETYVDRPSIQTLLNEVRNIVGVPHVPEDGVPRAAADRPAADERESGSVMSDKPAMGRPAMTPADEADDRG